MRSSVVIGVGNPAIADDALGIEVARSLKRDLAGCPGITVSEVYNGGLELMEAMAGFDRAFLVDAIVTGRAPGTIHRLTLDEVAMSRNTSTTHSGSIAVALEFGRVSGIKIPETVHVWAVEAADVTTFCEGLTAEVQKAVPVVAAEILQELFSHKYEAGRLDS
ncbi:MAG: hydrogenase maturation protease [Terracidiphilus sp.]|jgi:hydrogenase maturation protease